MPATRLRKIGGGLGRSDLSNPALMDCGCSEDYYEGHLKQHENEQHSTRRESAFPFQSGKAVSTRTNLRGVCAVLDKRLIAPVGQEP